MRLTFLLYFLCHTFSFASTWQLQITDPSFEVNNINLTDEKFTAYLKRTSWRCFVSEVEKKKDLYMRSLTCNYSIQKTGSFTQFISCDKTRKYAESLIELNDDKKNLNFQLKLTCKVH